MWSPLQREDAPLRSAPSLSDTIAAELLADSLVFTRYFFKFLRKIDFDLKASPPRRSYAIELKEALDRVVSGEVMRLMVNIQPRIGKTRFIAHWIAWCFANNPACEFLYVSHGYAFAEGIVSEIRDIMKSREYKQLFPWVVIRRDNDKKGEFGTTAGGSIIALGAQGGITGQGAGKLNADKFSGCIIVDDPLKAEDAFSETVREGINRFYHSTLLSRRNDTARTPIVILSQRLHESDLSGYLLKGGDGYDWTRVCLSSIDTEGCFITGRKDDKEEILMIKELRPYYFWSQYQQQPQPPGGAAFKRDDFIQTDDVTLFATFITADTAETSKEYNDATVFSFWGVYYLKQFGKTTSLLGLHWLDCLEIRVEPKDLEVCFKDFYASCYSYSQKPIPAHIEKESTGATLLSCLKEIQGLNVIDIKRNRKSKSQRFQDSQPYIASKQITFPQRAPHFERCVSHMEKITFNMAHAHDDIADTCADAIKLALIDKTFSRYAQTQNSIRKTYQTLVSKLYARD